MKGICGRYGIIYCQFILLQLFCRLAVTAVCSDCSVQYKLHLKQSLKYTVPKLVIQNEWAVM